MAIAIVSITTCKNLKKKTELECFCSLTLLSMGGFFNFMRVGMKDFLSEAPFQSQWELDHILMQVRCNLPVNARIHLIKCTKLQLQVT